MKKIKKILKRRAKRTILIWTIAGAYLLFLAYQLFSDLDAVQKDNAWYIYIFIGVFICLGLFLLVICFLALQRGWYAEAASSDDEEDEEEESELPTADPDNVPVLPDESPTDPDDKKPQ